MPRLYESVGERGERRWSGKVRLEKEDFWRNKTKIYTPEVNKKRKRYTHSIFSLLTNDLIF
jgi:hypothetical protein